MLNAAPALARSRNRRLEGRPSHRVPLGASTSTGQQWRARGPTDSGHKLASVVSNRQIASQINHLPHRPVS